MSGDPAGHRIGKFTILAYDPQGRTLSESALDRLVKVQCDCGTIKIVSRAGLNRHPDKGCGDRAKHDYPKPPAYRHGMATHELYPTWHSMIVRCENPRTVGYRHYGARGIKVCERWHDPAAFIADIEREIGPRPEGCFPRGVHRLHRWSLDRIDSDGNYEPGNVRWATKAEQAANQRPRRPSRTGD